MWETSQVRRERMRSQLRRHFVAGSLVTDGDHTLLPLEISLRRCIKHFYSFKKFAQYISDSFILLFTELLVSDYISCSYFLNWIIIFINKII